MSQKKIDLIAQLLAKAESTTPEEAEALTAAAEALMAKYMIDQAVIDDRRARSGQSTEKIVEFRYEFTGPYRGEMLHMLDMVAWGMGTLRSMRNTQRQKTFYGWLVGYESDVEQAKTLLASLQVQSAVAVRTWWKTERSEHVFDSSYVQEKARRSFVHGFGTGVGKRIHDNRNQLVEEATPGTAMVLTSRLDKVNEHVSGAHKLTPSRARTATGRDSAASHGYVAGQNANTGERSLSAQQKGITA